MRVLSSASCLTVAAVALVLADPAAGAGGRALTLNKVLSTLPKKRSLTKISSSSVGLCGSANTLEVPAQAVCAESQQTVLSDMKWEPCCPFANPGMEHCRTYEVGQPYCAKSVPECLGDTQGIATCDDLDETDQMTLSLTFKEEEKDSCCRTCTCFGDPECVSFSGAMDLWIPCDARQIKGKSCKMYKDTCEGMMGPNGQECAWVGSGTTSKGVDFPMEGSPCQPVGTPQEITMSMFDSGDNKIELGLGERGIIQLVTVRLNGIDAVLDAKKCFSEGGAAAWGLDELPSSNWVETVEDENTLIAWSVKDATTKTLLRLVCIRAVTKKGNGLPRINVQELAVDNDKDGEGFCSTGVISDKNGDNDLSSEMHETCTQNQTSALQACKFLVEMATPASMIDDCAASYCNRAATGKQKCEKTLRKSDSDKAWLKAYCESVLIAPKYAGTAPSSLKECMRVVKAEGYGIGTELFGQGYKIEESESEDDECGSSIAEYAVDEDFATCEFGINLQVLRDDGLWITKYFIPKSKPLCDDVITINGAEAPQLFTNAVRIQQCDSKGTNKQCQALSTCDAVFGVDFQISYSSEQANLKQLLDNGLLHCAPLNGDTTWCLGASASNYVPVDKVCECKESDDVLGRRTLLELARR